MTSVTNRIKVVKQPRGGYIPLKQFSAITLDDGKILNSDESVSPGLVGMAVDYLTRLMNGAHPKEAFKISLNGAYLVGEFDKAISLLDKIVGLDNQSIAAACILVGYDVAFRAGPARFMTVDTIYADEATIENIRIMVQRSLHFFEIYGPITLDGFTFDSAYTDTITSGDGDYLTKDTLWDFKVIKSKPNKDYTLQVLIYYLMGIRSNQPEFLSISKLGFFNPRQNIVYQTAIADIPKEVIETVEKNVIGYTD